MPEKPYRIQLRFDAKAKAWNVALIHTRTRLVTEVDPAYARALGEALVSAAANAESAKIPHRH